MWYIYIYLTYIHFKILFTNILCFSKHPELLVRHLEMPHIQPTGKYQRWHIDDKFFIIFSQASFNKNFLQEQYKTFWTFYYNPLNKSPRKYLLYHALCPSLSLGNLCVVNCALRLKEGNHFKFHTWYCWASALQKMWGWGPSHLFKVLSNGYFVYLYYQDEEKCSLSSDFHTDSAIIESLLYSATEMHTSLHFSPS